MVYSPILSLLGLCNSTFQHMILFLKTAYRACLYGIASRKELSVEHLRDLQLKLRNSYLQIFPLIQNDSANLTLTRDPALE